MAARLYIYSNELAAQGKYFKEGFYQNDVQKAVFIVPPLEGTELAYFSVLSPFLMWGGVTPEQIQRLSQSFSDAAAGVSNSLKGPMWNGSVNVMWPYIGSVQALELIYDINQLKNKKNVLWGYMGVDTPPRFWNQASVELMPDEMSINPLGQDMFKIVAPLSAGRIIGDLKRVGKAAGAQEPGYGIVYATGPGTMRFTDSLISVGTKILRPDALLSQQVAQPSFWQLPRSCGHSKQMM